MLGLNIKKDIVDHEEARLPDGTLSIIVQDVEFYEKNKNGDFILVKGITVTNEVAETLVER